MCALEGITIEGAECDILWEIHQGVKDSSSEDLVVLAIKELERLKGKSLQSSEWALENGLCRFHDCIYVPMVPDL